jgi:DNA-binding IclR family transcriptional regulator
MDSILDKVVVVTELADLAGFTAENIRRLTPDLISAGLARKAGKTTLFIKDQALEWLKDRPETRGRKKGKQ